jgi:hypothetical protein
MAACHAPETNCGPLLVVNLLNQLLRAARQASEEVEARGKASSHPVLLSMAVRR